MMYVFEYLVYHLKPYGISTRLINKDNISGKLTESVIPDSVNDLTDNDNLIEKSDHKPEEAENQNVEEAPVIKVNIIGKDLESDNDIESPGDNPKEKNIDSGVPDSVKAEGFSGTGKRTVIKRRKPDQSK